MALRRQSLNAMIRHRYGDVPGGEAGDPTPPESPPVTGEKVRPPDAK